MIFGYACDRCREKHQSCNHKTPCSRCIKASVAELCHYTPKKSRSKSQPSGIRRSMCTTDLISAFSAETSNSNIFDINSSPPFSNANDFDNHSPFHTELLSVPHMPPTGQDGHFSETISKFSHKHFAPTTLLISPNSLQPAFYPLNPCLTIPAEANLMPQDTAAFITTAPPLYQIVDPLTKKTFLSPFPLSLPNPEYVPYSSMPTSVPFYNEKENFKSTDVFTSSPQKTNITAPPQVTFCVKFL